MRKQLPDLKQWHPVFAWWPVTTEDGVRVWLETVERRYRFSSWFDDYFEFRLPCDSGSGPEGGDAKQAPGDSPAERAEGIAQTPSGEDS